MTRTQFVTGALGLFAAGCNNTTKLPPPFIFDRPGDVELVCYATTAKDAAEQIRLSPDARANDFSLPFECCQPVPAEGCPPAVKHALVTQTARGEVAAVDVTNEEVLDSDLRVPGYTFVDVGPFPTALVVPSKLPQEAGEAAAGPAWAYIAGGGDIGSVRAVPTCRFLLGKECGPETLLKAAANGDETFYSGRTELRLIGTPQDMVLDPSERALWVTLPEQGLLAKVLLGNGEESPFASSGSGLAEPTYFELPKADGTAALADAKDDTQDARCGADPYATAPLRLPRSEPMTVRGPAHPNRMRILPGRVGADKPARENLLLIADRGQGVLHAIALPFTDEDPSKTDLTRDPEVRASMPVNAKLVDFAVTRDVPNSQGGPDQQYLYALDELGGLAAFELTFDQTTPQLTPLLAPVTRRVTSGQRMASDRFLVHGNAVSSVALDVVDTREVGFACEPKMKSNWFQGVFVAVISRTGGISLLDVYDEANNLPSSPDCRCLVEDEDDRVPTRRHAPRLVVRPAPSISVSSAQSLTTGCDGDGYRPIEDNVCLPDDPWRQRNGTWSVEWQGSVGAVADAQLVGGEDDNTLELLMPAQRDLCELGVFEQGFDVAVLGAPKEGLTGCPTPTVENAQLLRITAAYSDKLRVELEPVDANSGRLALSKADLLRCYPEGINFEIRTRETFLVRGPGGIQHRIHADPSTVGQPNRPCVVDERLDALVTSIATPDTIAGDDIQARYRDANISFVITESAVKSRSTPLTIGVTKAGSLQGLDNADGSSGRFDKLPARVRYFPKTNDLFVVDEASQGLRRYTYKPFEPDDSRFR